MAGRAKKARPKGAVRKPVGVEIGVASVRAYTPQQTGGRTDVPEACLHCAYETSPSFNAGEARRLAAWLLKFADWAEKAREGTR